MHLLCRPQPQAGFSGKEFRQPAGPHHLPLKLAHQFSLRHLVQLEANGVDQLSPRLIAQRLQIQQLHGPVIGGAPFRGGHAALLQEKRPGRQGLLIARALHSPQKPGSRQLQGPHFVPRVRIAPAVFLRQFRVVIPGLHPHLGVSRGNFRQRQALGEFLAVAHEGQPVHVPQRRHDPVQRAAGQKRELPCGVPQPAGPLAVADGTHQQQPLFGPGQQHVENAQFLRQALPVHSVLNGRAGQGVAPGAQLRVEMEHANAQIPVAQHGILVFLQSNAGAHQRAEHHPEFQSLGMVHRHQPHHVVVFPQHVGGFPAAPGLESLGKGQESIQRPVNVPVEIPRPENQLVDIGLPLCAPGQRPHVGVNAAFVHHGANQPIQPHGPRPQPPGIQHL